MHMKEIASVFQLKTRHKNESKELESLYYCAVKW